MESVSSAVSSSDAEAGCSSDEEMRKLLKPNPSEDDIVKVLHESYVLDSSGSCENDVRVCKQLESYDDCNYLVEINNCKYILKVHNGVESDAYINSKKNKDSSSGSHIELMRKIFTHLNQPQFQVKTSLPVPPCSSSGNSQQDDDDEESSSIHKLSVVSKDHSPRELVVTLLEYVPGIPLSNCPSVCVETIADAGRYLGRVCTALDDLAATDDRAVAMSKRFHAWDGQHTPNIQKFLPYIEDSKRRQMVQNVIDTFTQTFVKNTDNVKAFRKGILQGDFNDANILLQNTKDYQQQISGVIDFGDSTYSWRILDVSVAMTYAMISTFGKVNRSLSAAAAMLRGVHSVYPILPQERKHLRLLIASRLACSATLGAYSIHMNPENKEYLSLHAEPAWKALTLIWGNNDKDKHTTKLNDAIDQLFLQACKDCPPSTKDNDIIFCTDISMPDPSVPDILQDVRKTSTTTTTNGDLSEEGDEPLLKRMKKEEPLTITFVTGNKKKLEEVKRILHFEEDKVILTNKKIDLPELQGNPLTIAKEKCALAAKEIGGPVITEDTSLCFNALNGLPGPYIKWFLDDCKHEGLVNMISFTKDKSGYAQTIVAYTPGPNEEITLFDGRTKGIIVPPRGSLDFGWDPIFQPDEGEGLTYAEMTKEGKDAISHRSRAFSQFRTFLEDQTKSST